MRNSNKTIQATWVLLGSLSAFCFTIISSMILSRYFDKQDYGTYKQVLYVYNTLLVVFTLGLPKAYSFFLPRVSKAEAKSLVNKINFVLIGSGFIMSTMLFLGSDKIAGLLRNEELSLLLKYFSLVPLFMLPTMGLEGILATYKKTRLLAFYTISTRILMLCCVTVPVVFFKGGIDLAIIGFSIASFISFVLAINLKYYPLKNEERIATKITYKEVLGYTLPIMFAGIWGILISSADQFFISRYFGREIFADFANGSLELPFITMIIGAGSLILAPIFSKEIFDKGLDARENIINIWRSVFVKTVKIVYPLVLFFFVYSDIVMIFLYGDDYATSGLYFKIKLLVNFFTIITYGPLILSIGGNKYYYKVHMYGALILILLQGISVQMINSPIAILVVSVFCQIGRIFAMLVFISKYFRIKLIDLFPIKLIVEILMVCCVILFATKFLIEDILNLRPISTLITASIVYLVFFSLWAFYRKLNYYSIVQPLVTKFFKK